MKRSTIVIGIAAFAVFIFARQMGWLRTSGPVTPETLASGCPQISQGAISLPDSHADDLAMLLNAADSLNHMGVCVIEGGWGVDSRMYYLAVQERGKKPEIRRYHGADLRKLASLGQR